MRRAITLVLLVGSSLLSGQETRSVGTAISELLATEQYEQADTVLQNRLLEYRNAGNLDSLAALPYYLGKTQLHLSGASQATRRAEQLVNQLDSLGATPRQLYQASMSLVYFLDEIGQVQ